MSYLEENQALQIVIIEQHFKIHLGENTFETDGGA